MTATDCDSDNEHRRLNERERVIKVIGIAKEFSSRHRQSSSSMLILMRSIMKNARDSWGAVVI